MHDKIADDGVERLRIFLSVPLRMEKTWIALAPSSSSEFRSSRLPSGNQALLASDVPSGSDSLLISPVSMTRM